MICPKCKMKMNNEDYCFHCGYMSNGNVIEQKEVAPTMLELYFGEKYDKYMRNKNWLIAGILGPIYIFCQGHYIIGLLLIALDYFISLIFLVFNHALLYYYVVLLLNFIYIVFNRTIWATIGNMIYIKLLTKRLSKMKETNYDKYESNIQQLYKKDHKFTILKYFIFGLLFLLIFYFIKEAIYNNAGLL